MNSRSYETARLAGTAATSFLFAWRCQQGKGGWGWEWTSTTARLTTASILCIVGVAHATSAVANQISDRQELFLADFKQKMEAQ